MRLAAPSPATLTISCPDGITLRTAPRLQEVYVEVPSRRPAAGILDQVYVEAVTRVVRWRGWGLPL